ncbi:MAG: FGGY-family carbohydrate kinase [Brooklawnia sp.]|jgi:L-xylulokinase
MNAKYVLGIDNGGTLTKAAIYDQHGNVHAVAQAKLTTLTPRPFFTERDIDEFWQANVNAIKRVLADSQIDPEDIAALAVTGHGNGIYFAREDGSAPHNGIISTDNRAQEYSDRWVADPDYDRRVRAKTGSLVWSGQPVALLAWFEDNMPELYDDTDYVMAAKDYIRFRLTGEAKMETSDSCGVSWANVVTKELDADVFDFFGIKRWMSKVPEFCDTVDIAGYVTEEAAKLTGLKAGTPVAGGMMDVGAGAIAAGLIDEGQLCVITGTWSINEMISRRPRLDADVFWTTVYPIPGTWLVMEGGPNGVSNLDWYINSVIRRTLDNFGHETLSNTEVFRICEKMIFDFTPSVDDPIFVPYINGTYIVPNGQAEFIGLNSFHDIRHMVRAVYEGVVFSHMYHINKLRDYTELGKTVRFTGGAANSEMWTQMFADGFGMPLEVVDAAESGTLGTAIASAVAAGIHPDMETAVQAMTKPPRKTVQPLDEFSGLFDKRYQRFAEHLEQLRK